MVEDEPITSIAVDTSMPYGVYNPERNQKYGTCLARHPEDRQTKQPGIA